MKKNNDYSSAITELNAARKWAKIQPQQQKLLLNNVFCSPCGVTTVVDYTLKDDPFGFVIIGKCQKCGKNVARYVEGND